MTDSDLIPVRIDYDTEFLPATESEELLVSALNEPMPLWALRYCRLFGTRPDIPQWVTWQRRAMTEGVELMKDKTKRRRVDGIRLDRGINLAARGRE